MSDRPLLSTPWEGNDGGDTHPAQFGRYSVVRELGKGGMACVYEGRHPQLGSRVALKVMNAALAAQPLAATRFLREAKASAQIRHENVVEVFDIGTQDGVPFIVMEFVEGSDLAALLAERGALPPSGLVDIFLPVISAIAMAHRAGIIHRDLKPANVMLARRPPRGVHPMVLDFGISKIVNDEGEETVTRSESLIGTVQYMAPELTKGARFATAASDQYALGVMLYECATGKRPFTGDSHYALMHAIVTAPVAKPSEIVPSLPPEFDAIVLRAMHRDPMQRFASVQALGSALLSFGDKTAWALWEGEFAGKLTDDRAPWSAGSQTLSDGLVASSASGVTPRMRPGTWKRWLVATLVLYAMGTTGLLIRRRADQRSTPTTPPTQAVSTGAALPLERPVDTAAVATIVPSPAPALPLAAPASEQAALSIASPLPSPIRRPSKGASTSKTASSSVARTSSPEAPANATTPPSVSPMLGTNGAPIVE